MTEGDLTDDQLAGLREFGVTHVILQENAFPAKVSLFPFGETLRRHFSDPRLRHLASNGGSQVFAVETKPSRRPSPDLPPPQATARHWRLDPPGTNAGVKLRSFAEIHRDGYGWLVRAEADRELVFATSVPGSGDPATTNRFPAVDGAEPGSWRLAWVPAPFPGTNLWTRLETPGAARISDVAFAADPAHGGLPALRPDSTVFLPAHGLVHEFGGTAGIVINGWLLPIGLGFDPSLDPPCVAVEGPGLPLQIDPGRYRAALDPADGPFRFADGAGLPGAAVSDDGRAIEFDYDGTSFADFRVLYDGSRRDSFSGIRIVPAD